MTTCAWTAAPNGAVAAGINRAITAHGGIKMLNDNDSSMAANAICHAAEMTRETIRMAVYEYERPSTVHKPRLLVDGNQWCALLGVNLQDGVAGFGSSPHEAMQKFDDAWYAKL